MPRGRQIIGKILRSTESIDLRLIYLLTKKAKHMKQMIAILTTEHTEGNNHLVKFAICLNESFQTIVNALVSRLKDLNIAVSLSNKLNAI